MAHSGTVAVPRLRQAGRVNFWRELSALERLALSRVGTRKTVYKGDTILTGGEPNLTILLSDCWVRLQTDSSSASRTVADMAGPGDLVSALHATNPRSPLWLGQVGDTFGVVLKKGEILEISGETIPVILSDLPEIQRLITHRLGVQLHIAIQLHASNQFDVGTRLARLLLSVLYRFGEREIPGSGTFALAPPLSQPDLAAWIGASETSVARVLRRWRLAGLIHTSHLSLSILDLRGLQAEAVAAGTPSSRPPKSGDRRQRSNFTTVEDAMRGGTTAEALTLNTDMPPGLAT